MKLRHSPIGATVLGFPRIGRDRELKKALDSYWSGKIDSAELERVSTAVRLDGLKTMAAAGLDTVPVNTFSWYDHMLDAAVLVGAVPPRFAGIEGADTLAEFDAARYFAMARGTAEVPPLEMTKWFGTNYHYLVPEIGPDTTFVLDAAKPLAEFREARARGIDARPVIVGPYTFLALAKSDDTAPDGFAPLDRLTDLVDVYVDLLHTLGVAGVDWVQLDEPALVLDLHAEQVEQVRRTYERLSAVPVRPSILVATYFADPAEALPALVASGVEAIGLDVLHGPTPERVRGLAGIEQTGLVLGAIEGHNIWRADLRATLAAVQAWSGIGATQSVGTSCSLLHVPYDAERETGLAPELRDSLAFADQKLAEVVAVQRALDNASEGVIDDAAAFAASDDALAQRAQIAHLVNTDVTGRLARVAPGDRQRPSRGDRATAQDARLGLPVLPTTTIGSFPQTTGLRKARAARRAGSLDAAAYAEQMRHEVREVVALQESLGLDVLVHGEPERNDMVQYFAEQLDGYAATVHGWVQSYGSRCVRPPILYGDVHRPAPMTVEWATFAQSLTTKPVKGMLTGPVTMLAWSFVREDQPRSVTADQVALSLRDEVGDLEAAGIAIVQVDEPALRETLPLRRAEQKAYLGWAVDAFRLATSGVRTDTQIHTHLCYSEFGEIMVAIDGLGADVTSIEAARSRMELLADISDHDFGGALGPGVYDIHSPRVPSAEEITELLRAALASLPAPKLWVNPDCGLKTRGYAEVEESLRILVAAAAALRAELSP
jgi:5-methyltetrahydropteroyltriglutamate--homocysteine methyltransferase